MALLELPEIEKQLPIGDKARAALVRARIDIFKDEMNRLAEQVYTGAMSIGQWQEAMKRSIRELHTAGATIGKGGWDEMSFSDWGKLGSLLKDQYRYLRGFAEYIADNADTISMEAIAARARMYGEAGGHTALIYSVNPDISALLPWLPKDGSTECLVNCKCRWVLKVINRTKTEQTIQATWELGEAEHCLDCVDRWGHTETFTLNINVQVPPFIGGY